MDELRYFLGDFILSLGLGIGGLFALLWLMMEAPRLVELRWGMKARRAYPYFMLAVFIALMVNALA